MPPTRSISAVSATITKFVSKPTGQIEITFSDGTTLFFGDASQVSDFYETLANSDSAKQLLLAWWIARSPDMSNVNLVLNKTLTFDLGATQPIKVQ